MAFNDEIMVASGEEYDPEHPSTEKATLEKTQSGGTYKTDDPTESIIDNADYFPFYDTSASVKKKTLWSTIADKIKTFLIPHYFKLSGEATVIYPSAETSYDLDTYITCGNYICPTEFYSSFVINQPRTSNKNSFNMVVMQNGRNVTLEFRQVLWYHDENAFYTRRTIDGGIEWSSWKNLSTDSTKLPLAGGTMTGIISRNITSGTSYINSPAGSGSMLHLNKSEGNNWYAMVSTRTAGGGGWAIGNYSNENLQFIYGTKANITSGTNSTTQVNLKPVAGTIAVHTATPTSGQVVISDGTDGGVKTSGYTIAKSVPSNAVFTDNNTTYTFATGDANGQIKVTPSGGSAQNVSVKGLGSNAYTSTAYAPLSGASFTGKVRVKYSDSNNFSLVLGDSDGTAGGLVIYGASYYGAFKEGSTALTANRTYAMPNKSGTLALTSDLSSYLPLSGGTITGNLLVKAYIRATNNIVSTGNVQGITRLIAGAHSAEVDGTTYAKAGSVRLYGASGTYYAEIKPNTMSADRTITLPASTCTIMGNNGGTFTGDVTIAPSSDTGTLALGASSSGGGGQLNIFFQSSGAKKYAAVKANTDMTANRIVTLPATTGTLSYSSSSRRVKKNIRDMTEDEAKKLLDIDIIKFDYKEFWNDGKKNQSGLIAEDVIKIIPEAVHIRKDYDPNQPVDEEFNFPPEVEYTKFVPYLIKMIQIQENRINELEAEIKVLKGA